MYGNKREEKIKKLILKSFTLILFIMIAMILSSCAVSAKQIKPHHQAFALVKTIVEVKIYECAKSEKTKKEECKYKSLGKKAALGSGTFFNYKNQQSFLTAGHVCLGPAYEIWDQLPTGSRVIPELHLQSYTGKEIKGKISYVNLKHDICIVEAKHPTVKRIPKVSIKKPILHSNYYSVVAPASIFNTGMVPVLRGLYVGDNNSFSFYTMPAAPGASGGAIYDSKDNIVGLVQRTHSAFPHVSLSVKHKDLSDILERYFELRKQGVESLIE